MKDKVKKYGLLIVKLLISVSIFVIIIHNVSKKETIDFLSFISYQLLFVIIITGGCQICLNSFIQRNLLSVYRLNFNFKNILLHNFISSLYVFVIPGFFAPDFYLGYYYTKENKSYSRVFSALFLNRVIGLSTFTFLAGIAFLILGPELIKKINISTGSINFSILIFVFLGVITTIWFIWYLIKDKLLKIIDKISEIWNETRNKKLQLFHAFSLKLIFNIVGLFGRLLIGYIVGVNIPVLEFASIILVLNLLISLPISFNGVGVREAGYVGLLSIMGVPGSTALLFALSEFGITLLGALIGFSIFTSIKTKELIIKLRK